MLSIRMQRTGRKGYPTYRVIVQEHQRTPTSGRYVAILGNYNPHTKELNLKKEKAEMYLKNGAQPTPRVIGLLKQEKIKLPSWVKEVTKQEKSIKNPEKLRKNRPEEPEAKKPVEEVVEEPSTEVAQEVETNEKKAEETEAQTGDVTEKAEEPVETKQDEEATAPTEELKEDEKKSEETTDPVEDKPDSK